ncbi:crossover junction endodeoxyribonuclease RuvC [Actinotignum timonense]|nr:crossover junction endodeoxyribonuclease RuvC [Actinotignum timonense]
MRILGIDPGLTRCGLGTIDADVTRRVRLVDMRVARSPVDLAPHRRLLLIADEIDAVIAEFSPEVVAVECADIWRNTDGEGRSLGHY